MAPSSRTPAAAVDVAAVGETLAMFVPEQPGPLTEPARYLISAAGAEANVARNLARLGASSAWLGRVGADPFGDFILDVLNADGVDVSRVERDAQRPTGVAFKEREGATTGVRYYRKGSAASALGAAFAHDAWASNPRILHLSGITPALSDDCLAFMRAVVESRPEGRLISFDVNWRAQLWTHGDPGVLRTIAQAADIVFVGLDEAHAAWNIDRIADVRADIDRPATLVVKLGAAGCVVFTNDRCTDVPALTVDVVEPVGAGDAFAAGFLLGMLSGGDARRSGRLGTIAASSALSVRTDVGVIPDSEYIDTLLGLSDDEWSRTRYTPREETRTHEYVANG